MWKRIFLKFHKLLKNMRKNNIIDDDEMEFIMPINDHLGSYMGSIERYLSFLNNK